MAGNLYTFAEIATAPVSADENFFIFFFKLSVLLSQQVKDSGESAGHIGHSRLVALTTPQLRCHRRGAEVTNYHSYIGLLFIWSWVRHQVEEEEEETGGRGGDGRAQEKIIWEKCAPLRTAWIMHRGRTRPGPWCQSVIKEEKKKIRSKNIQMSDFFFDCIFVNLFGGIFFSWTANGFYFCSGVYGDALYATAHLHIKKCERVLLGGRDVDVFASQKTAVFHAFFSCFDWRSGGHFLIHRPFWFSDGGSRCNEWKTVDKRHGRWGVDLVATIAAV